MSIPAKPTPSGLKTWAVETATISQYGLLKTIYASEIPLNPP